MIERVAKWLLEPHNRCHPPHGQSGLISPIRSSRQFRNNPEKPLDGRRSSGTAKPRLSQSRCERGPGWTWPGFNGLNGICESGRGNRGGSGLALTSTVTMDEHARPSKSWVCLEGSWVPTRRQVPQPSRSLLPLAKGLLGMEKNRCEGGPVLSLSSSALPTWTRFSKLGVRQTFAVSAETCLYVWNGWRHVSGPGQVHKLFGRTAGAVRPVILEARPLG